MVTRGLRPGAKTQTVNTVIKLVRMEKKNGVRSGVSQATSPGARSGRAVSHKICRGEKTGAPRALNIGMNGGDVTTKAHKFWSAGPASDSEPRNQIN
jgi:hypothetical protein